MNLYINCALLFSVLICLRFESNSQEIQLSENHKQLESNYYGVYSYVNDVGKIVTVKYSRDPIDGFITLKDPYSNVVVDIPLIGNFEKKRDSLVQVAYSK